MKKPEKKECHQCNPDFSYCECLVYNSALDDYSAWIVETLEDIHCGCFDGSIDQLINEIRGDK